MLDALFRTVLTMSLLGGGLTALLLCLKPLLLRRLPAHWQRRLWILALVALLLPLYRLLPGQTVFALLQPVPETTVTAPAAGTQAPAPAAGTQAPATVTAPTGEAAAAALPSLTHWLPVLWLLGVVLYLGVVLASYLRFLRPLRARRVPSLAQPLLDAVGEELHLRRPIPLYAAPGLGSPFLMGLLFPAVYLPDRDLPPEALRMILLHELTHYKKKDLLLKWLALFINAVHWFDPLAYLLRRALSEACELACDQAVTAPMSPQERKQYMATILSLATH